jgi:DNA-binding beta-propeller fold protein YncE
MAAAVALVAAGFCPVARPQSIVVANEGDNTVQELGPGGTTTTYATGDLNEPIGVVFDAAGNLYVSNFGDNTITKFDAAGDSSLFANMGLDEPKGMAFDAYGNLYVANFGNSTVEEISPSGHTMVFASAGVYQPYDLAFNPVTGNLFVANNNGTIEQFNASGKGTLFASGLDEPTGIVFDSQGDLYTSSSWDDHIYEYTPSGHKFVFANTGIGNDPIGLTFDSSGDLIVSCADGLLEEFGPNAPQNCIINTNQSSPWFFATNVPEPSSGPLLAVGLVTVFGWLKLRARKNS